MSSFRRYSKTTLLMLALTTGCHHKTILVQDTELPLPVHAPSLQVGMNISAVQQLFPHDQPQTLKKDVSILTVTLAKDDPVAYIASLLFKTDKLLAVQINPTIVGQRPLSEESFSKLQEAFRDKCNAVYGTHDTFSLDRGQAGIGTPWRKFTWDKGHYTVTLMMAPPDDKGRAMGVLGGLSVLPKELVVQIRARIPRRA